MKSKPQVSIRQVTPNDIESCGQIIYTAFKEITAKHGYPCEFKKREDGIECAKFQISHPAISGIVAEIDNQIVGSNFLTKLNSIYGLGPITVDPKMQGYGIGRMLMKAIMEIGKSGRGIRLMQDAYNPATLSLYSSLGFTVKEPLMLLKGKIKDQPRADVEVRPLQSSDFEECAALCRKVLGFDRTNDLREAIELDKPLVALRDRRIIAYATAITHWTANHAVAENHEDMIALISGAAAIYSEPFSFLLPTRNAELAKWCFQQDLKGVNPRTLMALGEYQEINGTYLPSVLF